MSGEPGAWATGILQSPAARWVSGVVVVVATLGASIAGAVGVLALLRGRPVDGVTWFLLPAIPTLLLGQLWMITYGWARMPPRRWGEKQDISWATYSPRRFFFGELQRPLSYLLLTLATSGWLLGMTSFASLAHGGPAGSRANCPYVLNNHGSLSCVTQKDYEEAGAAEQRLAAGVLLAFYSLHLGSAASALVSRGGRVMSQLPSGPQRQIS